MRVTDMKLFSPPVKSKAVAESVQGSQETNDDPVEQGSGENQQGQSLGGASGGAGGDDGDHHGSGGAGSGSGGQHGGSGGGDDGHNDGDDDDDDNEQDHDDSDEEPEHPSTASTHSSNNSGPSSVPELIHPSTLDRTPPRVAGLEQHLGESSHSVADYQINAPLGAGDNPIEISESEGGISDAPTAVVSDSEGHGQVIGLRSEHANGSSSPGTSPPGVSPRGGVTSSALSTLSSFSTSSNSSEKETDLMRPPRKRPPGKLHHGQQKRKRAAKSDVSSETDNTSTTTTATTSTTSTTTSDTSGHRSHDMSDDQSEETSGDKSHDTSDGSHDTAGSQSHDTSGDEPRGPFVADNDGHQCSQEDMFVDNGGQVSESKDQPAVGALIQDMLCTPAEKISSLSLSGQSVKIPETMDDGSQSQSIIPPTQDAYGPVPYLIPSSPTGSITESQRSTKERLPGELKQNSEDTMQKSESLHLFLANTEQFTESLSANTTRKVTSRLQAGENQECETPRSSHPSERTLTADTFNPELSSSQNNKIISQSLSQSKSSLERMEVTGQEIKEQIHNLLADPEDDIGTTQDLALRMSPSQEPSLHVAEADASAGQCNLNLPKSENILAPADALMLERATLQTEIAESVQQKPGSQTDSLKLQLMCTETEDINADLPATLRVDDANICVDDRKQEISKCKSESGSKSCSREVTEIERVDRCPDGTVYELDTETCDNYSEYSKSVRDKNNEHNEDDSMTQQYSYTKLMDRSCPESQLDAQTLNLRSEVDQAAAPIDKGLGEQNTIHAKDPRQMRSPEQHHSDGTEHLTKTKVTGEQQNAMTSAQAVRDPYDYRMSQSQHDKMWKDHVLQLAEKSRSKMMNRRDETVVISQPSVSGKISEGHGRGLNPRSASTQIIQDSVQELPEGAVLGHTYHTVTIKTVYCHTVTLQEERIGGRTINSRVIKQHFKTMSQTVETADDSFSSSSPSNARHSLSSGNLGDISSIEVSSAGNSHINSNITSPLSGIDQVTSATTASPSLSKSTSGSDAAVQIRSREVLSRAQRGGASTDQRTSSDKNYATGLVEKDQSSLKHCLKDSVENEFAQLETIDRSRTPNLNDPQMKSNSALDARQKDRKCGSDIAHADKRTDVVRCNQVKSSHSVGKHPAEGGNSMLTTQDEVVLTNTEAESSTGKRKRQVNTDSSPESLSVKRSSKKGMRKVTGVETGNVINVEVSEDKVSMSEDSSNGDASPEIPITGKIKLPSRTKSQTVVMATLNTKNLKTGTPVFARWKDKHYYPAHIISSSKNKYVVGFEDGDTRHVKETDIIVCNLLPKGQQVMAARDNGDYEVGVVMDLTNDSVKKGCMIKFLDDATEYVSRDQVILDPEQAKMFKESLAAENYSSVEQSAEAQHQQMHSSQVIGELTILRSKPGRSSKEKVAKHGNCSDSVSEEIDENRNEKMSSKEPSLPTVEDYLPFEPYLAQLSLLSAETPVYAMWRDKHFYPGVVRLKLEGTDKYEIAFDDGDVHLVRDSDMIVCELVTVGQDVLAERHLAEGHEPGVILGHYKQGSTVGYIVEFTDMKRERIPRANVILRLEQARSLIADIRGPIGSPQKSAADVSLDNLIDGKRRRGSPNRDKENSNKKSTSSNKKIPSSSGKKLQNTEKSESSAKRNKLLTPSATSTPTPKRRDLSTQLENSPSLAVLLKNSPRTRPSPRKSKTALFPSEIKGPIPDSGSKLFRGITFILTCVDRAGEKSKRVTDSSGDLSSLTQDEEVPFDREYLQEQITAGGGIILDQFDRHKVEAAKCCYLVSNTYHRTVKYFCSLAAGIPCLSHLWIRDACRTGKCPDISSYLLPAGYNIEKKRLNVWTDHCGGLQGLNVYVTSENKTFVSLWQLVLASSPCNVLNKLPSLKKAKLMQVHVISDHSCNHQMAAQVQQLGLPHLSSEWIIQCLINGERVSYTGHPKYRWDYQE